MTRTAASLARVARWPYAGLPPKSTNSLITSSMSARDPSGLPNGPTGSSRRRLLAIFTPPANRSGRPQKELRLAFHLVAARSPFVPFAGRMADGLSRYARGGCAPSVGQRTAVEDPQFG